MSERTCEVAGCDKKHYAHGICKTHDSYVRRGTKREDLRSVRSTNYRRGQPCTIDDCVAVTIAGGLCSTHYSRRRRTGTTEDPAPFIFDAAKDKARRRAYARAWKAAEYHRNRDRVRERHNAWLAANPERVRLHHARKRQTRRTRMGQHVYFSADQLAQKIAYWGSSCWMCGVAYEAVDHVKPAAKGGPHMLANLRPICRSCNSKKRDHWPFPVGARARG